MNGRRMECAPGRGKAVHPLLSRREAHRIGTAQKYNLELIGEESAAPSVISKFNLAINDFGHLSGGN